MKAYGFKKGLLLTFAISFLSIAIDLLNKAQFILAGILGTIGFGLLCIFVYLMEKQTVESAVQAISLRKRTKKK